MGIVRNADKYLYQTEIEINIVVNDEWLVVNMPVVSRRSPLTTHHLITHHSPLKTIFFSSVRALPHPLPFGEDQRRR